MLWIRYEAYQGAAEAARIFPSFSFLFFLILSKGPSIDLGTNRLEHIMLDCSSQGTA